MFGSGFANWSYVHRQRGRFPRPRSIRVLCGNGYLEEAVESELYASGLTFPEGILTIDKEQDEITIIRSLALSEKGPSVFYKRLYSSRHGTRKLVMSIDQVLERAYAHKLDEQLLSDEFEKYLVNGLNFMENATIRSSKSQRVEVQTSVSFPGYGESLVPKPQIESSVCLERGFVEQIAEAYQNSGRDLSARRRKLLEKKELLCVPAFLRAVDIPPATSKYESKKAYRNLRKCCSILFDIAFQDFIGPYSISPDNLDESDSSYSS